MKILVWPNASSSAGNCRPAVSTSAPSLHHGRDETGQSPPGSPLTLTVRASSVPVPTIPARPRAAAEHLVALQEGAVELAEGVARPPHPHVLHQPQVPRLCQHQLRREHHG